MQTPEKDRRIISLTSVSKSILQSKSPHLSRILKCSSIINSPNNPPRSLESKIITLYNENIPNRSNQSSLPEQISPNRILDAPKLEDDYYLNLLDWSVNNLLTVGLSNEIFIWNATLQKTHCLSRLLKDDDRYTSLAYSSNGAFLIAGTKNGCLELFDMTRLKLLRKVKVHSSRVGVSCWRGANTTTSGSRDRAIQMLDWRSNCKTDSNERICEAHEQEICGLQWEPRNGHFLASGGNDNQLLIWDERKFENPIIECSEHAAAVKAIAWSPHHRGLLASGGGTADRSIRFWSITGQANQTISSISKVITTSQVCSLKWSPHQPEILSAHGFSEHQCLRWTYPEMEVTGVMKGHDQRILYLAVSPDGRSVATGSPDETIRIWPAFRDKNTSKYDKFWDLSFIR